MANHDQEICSRTIIFYHGNLLQVSGKETVSKCQTWDILMNICCCCRINCEVTKIKSYTNYSLLTATASQAAHAFCVYLPRRSICCNEQRLVKRLHLKNTDHNLEIIYLIILFVSTNNLILLLQNGQICYISTNQFSAMHINECLLYGISAQKR